MTETRGLSYNLQSFRYDRKRVEEIGPDRACAEWLLRCGGAVRFKNFGSLTSNYNAIPNGSIGHFQVEEIRAVKACITSDGFAHLSRYFVWVFLNFRDFLRCSVDGLNALKKIHLEKCDLVTDSKNRRHDQLFLFSSKFILKVLWHVVMWRRRL